MILRFEPELLINVLFRHACSYDDICTLATRMLYSTMEMKPFSVPSFLRKHSIKVLFFFVVVVLFCFVLFFFYLFHNHSSQFDRILDILYTCHCTCSEFCTFHNKAIHFYVTIKCERTSFAYWNVKTCIPYRCQRINKTVVTILIYQGVTPPNPKFQKRLKISCMQISYWSLFFCHLRLGRRKKDVCLPFSDRPKILENNVQLFFSFFFLIPNFAFLHKNVKIRCHNIQ